MPVSSEVSIAGPFTPNGETRSFPFAFKAASASEVVAVDSDGTLISTALYSVTLDDDEGGTLTFGTAPEVADYPVIYVLSEPALTQPADFDNAGPSFNPAALTRAIDRAAIRDLKLNRDIGRALKLPFGEVPVTFPGVAERANKFVSFLPDGSLLMSSGTGADAGLREDVAASGGAALVGLTADQDVSAALGEVFSVGRDGALPATANNGTVIAAAFDAQKQATSISYNATTIPMDAKKSVQLSGQYIVKNKIDLWAKTSVIALNALNSGMTLAADATDNVLFRFSGSTALPAWGNQNNIIGGAYNILKAGGALVRKNPDFPRAFSDPGGSFMTNWNVKGVTFAGPYGIQLGDVYSQQVTISDFHCVGTVDQILSVQGHYILIDGLDKTGFTGTTTEPLMVLGDPDNINPTTNITCRRVILDLNGNANKDSISIFNAKNTLLDEYHNELSAFKTMLRVADSYGTRVTRSAFVTSVTTDLIALVNSDLTMDQYEANNTDKWWSVFTLDGQSPLVIDRLRQFNSGVVPVVPNIDVKEIQRVSSVNEKRLPIVAKDPIGNLLYNPAFMNGVVGWTIDGGATVQVLDDNEYIPGGKMLRITYAADQAGIKYINQLIPFMNVAEFDDKAITLTMVGKVTHGGSFSSTSYMGPCDTSFAITEGRIYANQGLVFGSDIVVDSNGNAYFGIANPRAGWTYDIHFLEANIGRQRSASLPLPMDTGWTAATGTAAKGAYASYAGQDVSAAYVEAEAQATDDAVKALSQRLIALETAMREIGGIDG